MSIRQLAPIKRVEVSARVALHRNNDRATSALAKLRVVRRAALCGPAAGTLTTLARRVSTTEAAPRAHGGLVTCDDPDAALTALRRDGIVEGLALADDAVDELRSWWQARPDRRRIADPHTQIGLVDDVFHDPLLLDLAASYLEAEPIPFETVMHVVPPDHGGGYDRNREGFHYEKTDLRALMVYFFLTDTTPDDGGHQVVAGTHRQKSLREIVREQRSHDEVARDHGDSPVITVCGPRGSGFAEDNAVLHRRMPVTRPRLTLTLIFTLRRQRPDGACGYYSSRLSTPLVLTDDDPARR